jgi:hypothetical protein
LRSKECANCYFGEINSHFYEITHKLKANKKQKIVIKELNEKVGKNGKKFEVTLKMQADFLNENRIVLRNAVHSKMTFTFTFINSKLEIQEKSIKVQNTMVNR